MTCKTYCRDNISRKLFYLTIVTDRKMNCIYEHDRIYFIKRAILPFFYLWEQPVGNIRHHSVTYFKAVNILNSFAYLTGRHTFIGVLAAILVPSMMGYVGDSKFSTANSNAKLVFTNTATYATKCEVSGYPMSAGNGLSSATSLKLSGDASTVTAPSDASSINLEAALKNLMGSTADSSGYCRVAIGSTGSPSAALWAKSTSDKYVGGYPTAATGQTTGGIGSATLSATTTPSGTES